MAAVPSTGRASRVEGAAEAPEADAAGALYEQYAGSIYRFCLNRLGSREEAEDAVQSTFLNAFRGIRRGIVPELESAWLFKIAHNVCLSRRRSSWRRGRVEAPADFEVVEEFTPAPSRRADELIGLQDVLEQLPETQRRAILLREWQGLSYREIAQELELSQAAVETLIFRARRALASGLEKPPAPRRRRIARALDFGNVAAGLKSLLIGGTTAAKVAATIAAVSATTVVATRPAIQHRLTITASPAGSVPHAVRRRHVAPARSAALPVSHAVRATAPKAAPTRARHAAVRHAARPREHAVPAPVTPTVVPVTTAAEAPVVAPPPAAPVEQPAPQPAAPVQTERTTPPPATQTAPPKEESERTESRYTTMAPVPVLPHVVPLSPDDQALATPSAPLGVLYRRAVDGGASLSVQAPSVPSLPAVVPPQHGFVPLTAPRTAP